MSFLNAYDFGVGKCFYGGMKLNPYTNICSKSFCSQPKMQHNSSDRAYIIACSVAYVFFSHIGVDEHNLSFFSININLKIKILFINLAAAWMPHSLWDLSPRGCGCSCNLSLHGVLLPVFILCPLGSSTSWVQRLQWPPKSMRSPCHTLTRAKVMKSKSRNWVI